MTIGRWDSYRDIAAHQDRLSRMFEGFYGRPQEDLARGSWVSAVDIYSNGQHELVLKAELPDLKENAETYGRGAYAGVLKTLEQVVEGTPRVKTYEVSNSTFHKIAARATA